MRRSILLLATFALCLATGFALLHTATLITAPPPMVHSATHRRDAAESVDLVRRFYAAVNDVIRTGDASVLTPLVTADFTHHAVCPEQTSISDGFVDCLLALHIMAPTMRLTIEEMFPSHDLVVLSIRVEGATLSPRLGPNRYDIDDLWGAVNVVRLVEERIAEHWGGEVSTLLRPILSFPVTRPWVSSVEIQVERFLLQPNAALRFGMGPASRGIVVEAGDPTVAFVSDGTIWPAPNPREVTQKPYAVRRGGRAELTVGDMVTLDGWGEAALTASNESITVVLVVSLNEPPLRATNVPVGDARFSGGQTPEAVSVSTEPTRSLPPGVERTLHLRQSEIMLRSGQSLISIDQVTMTSAADVTLTDPDALIWLAAEAGEPRVSWRNADDHTKTTEFYPATVDSMTSLVAVPERSVMIDSVGSEPLSLLVLTIVDIDIAADRPPR